MRLKNFVDLNEIEKVLVYGWRNHLKIAPFMRTQTITLKEHLQFMESLKQDSTVSSVYHSLLFSAIFFGFAKR